MRAGLGALVVGFPSVFSTCPVSGPLLRAQCKVTATVATRCAFVTAEVRARVEGQRNDWHDPHNNGLYTITKDRPNTGALEMSRTTGDRLFTDKMILTFTDRGDVCVVDSCSASQVLSVGDFGTNYCNLRMLLCSSADGCRPVRHDVAYTETEVTPSFGAGTDPTACFAPLPSPLTL